MQGDQAERSKRARRVLLCATGAFQSYSLPGFILQLIHHFADDVQVVLSRSAAKMVSRYAVEVASRNRVFVEIDDCGDDVYVPHIELGQNVATGTRKCLSYQSNRSFEQMTADFIIGCLKVIFAIM